MTPVAAFVKAVSTYLNQTLQVPGEVIFGHEGFDRVIPQTPRVQVLYDEDAGDTFVPPGVVRGAPPPAVSWWKRTGCVALIQGASDADGAAEDDHKAVVELLVDYFLVAAQAIAHNNRNLVQDVKGRFVPFDAGLDGTPGQAEFGARYELHFSFLRAVLEPPAQKIAKTNLVPAQGVLVAPQTNVAPITGNAASITAFSSPKATVGGLSGITSSVVGLAMSISGASNPLNNGTFPITDFIDGATVKIANPAGSAPDGFNGHLIWSITNAEVLAA